MHAQLSGKNRQKLHHLINYLWNQVQHWSILSLLIIKVHPLLVIITVDSSKKSATLSCEDS